MRVDSISPKIHTIPIKRNESKSNQTQNDSLAFLSDKISFCKSFETRYKALKLDLIDYVTSAYYIDEKELEQIFKRHCPNAKFEKMERVYVGDNGTVSYVGDTQKEYAIRTTLSDKRKAILKNQTITAVLPENSSKEEELFFISRLLHEGTHALQSISPDRKTELDAINNLIKKKGYSTSIKDNLELASKIYESLYAELLELSSEAISAELPAGEDNPRNLTAQTACKNYYGVSVEIMALEMLEGVLEDFSDKIDKDFALEYCINIANCEIEAYSKEIEYLKSRGYDYRKTLSQIKIEINEAIIDAINSIK